MSGSTDLTIVTVTTIVVPGSEFNALGTLAPVADHVQNLSAAAVQYVGANFPAGTTLQLDTQMTGGFNGVNAVEDLTPTDPEVAAEG